VPPSYRKHCRLARNRFDRRYGPFISPLIPNSSENAGGIDSFEIVKSNSSAHRIRPTYVWGFHAELHRGHVRDCGHADRHALVRFKKTVKKATHELRKEQSEIVNRLCLITVMSSSYSARGGPMVL
jgi:hypothetical protein